MESWAVIQEIKKRIESAEALSQIARELQVDRKTVRKYRDLSDEEIRDERRQGQGRPDKLGEHKAWLKERVKTYEGDGVVNAVSLHRELVERGYEGSVRSVRRAVARMVTRARRRIYEPFETPMGQQAMVDLGEARKTRVGNGLCTIYFVLMVLACSRKKYGEWYERPISTEMFIEFHERAFRFFEGIPEEVVYDQTKLAVIQERFGECEFNADFYPYAKYCGFKPYICNKNDPESKGKIEAVVRYAKRGFLPGRSFVDYVDIQRQWDEWVVTVADAKVHETTRRVPNEVWEEEKKHLKPVPVRRFSPQPSMEKRQALGTGLVKVLGNRYSLPSSYQGEDVFVRVTEERVEIYNINRDCLCSHWRCYEKGKTIKDPAHYTKEYSVSTEELEAQVMALYGSKTLLEGCKARFPRHYREQLKGLIRMERDHAEEDLKQGALRAANFNCFSLSDMQKIVAAIEANRASMPLRHVNGGASLPAGDTEVRGLSYYEQIAQEIQEEQDEQASI